MTQINIIGTSVEEAERLFHGVLPLRCVEFIVRLADDNRALQQAVNALLENQTRMVEALQLQSKANHQYRNELNAIARRFDTDPEFAATPTREDN